MKKVLLGILLILTIFTLTACDNDDNDDEFSRTKMSAYSETIS